MRIPVTLTAVALALGIVAAANSQVYKPSGGGSSSVTSGTTASSGCVDTAVLESRANLITCDGAILAPAAGPVSIGNGGATTSQLSFTPNSGTAASFGMTNAGTTLTFFSGATAQLSLGSGVAVDSGNGFRWTNSASNPNTTLDTSIFRQAAGVVEVGTGAANASGNILASGFGPGTIYSAAGTVVPACAAGTNGWTIVASDITTATYRTLYASGGANTGRLFCVNGTGWLSD